MIMDIFYSFFKLQTRHWSDWDGVDDCLSPFGNNLKNSLHWIFSTNTEPIVNVLNTFEPELRDGSSFEEARWFENNVLQDYRQFSFHRETEARLKRSSLNNRLVDGS